jgi:pyridoxine 5-phosphate synthase
VRRLTLALDALAALRDVSNWPEAELAAAATLAELAGVDAVRLGISEDLRPVREEDALEVRRTARRLELRMPPSHALLKVALEVRPDRVMLAAGGPLDLRVRGAQLGPLVRALDEAGIPAWAVVAPDLESVKIAHAEGVAGIELFTGAIVDLPGPERSAELQRLGDAARLASKLRLPAGLGGSLSFRSLPEVVAAAPACSWVTVGRAALTRAMLVGLDRALRDLRERIG